MEITPDKSRGSIIAPRAVLIAQCDESGALPTLFPFGPFTLLRLTAMPPQPLLKRVMEHRAALTRDEGRNLMQQIFTGQFSDLELAALLGAISARGEDPAELAGFVDTMRSAAIPVPLDDAERSRLVDTCGTGGDASGTFNISTAAALVAAAAGVPAEMMVAKHGNRAVTSQCGSADVL
jgi:anthranilate phosphoribosyltransferase